jgi:2-polyprenyl-3-methyl-5-hydroxy-6-metoxy-1,4-benzoquinol methylase
MNILQKSTDKEWERIGQSNPYFGVLSYEKYKSSSLDEELKEEFFKSGSGYIDGIMDFIQSRFQTSSRFKRSLDFGCGVGRLVVPLSNYSDQVIGVDVSDSMIKEAKANCQERNIQNITFVKSDDSLSRLEGSFDLMHSIIVFQHIPAKRGELIFEKLVSHLEPGGIGVFHFTYGSLNNEQKKIELFKRIKAFAPLLQKFVNLCKGRGWSFPLSTIMEMNHYDLNHLFETIDRCGVHACFVDMSNKGGESHHKHVQLFFQRK